MKTPQTNKKIQVQKFKIPGTESNYKSNNLQTITNVPNDNKKDPQQGQLSNSSDKVVKGSKLINSPECEKKQKQIVESINTAQTTPLKNNLVKFQSDDSIQENEDKGFLYFKI